MAGCDVSAGSLGMPNAQRAFQDLRVVGNRSPVFFQALEIHGDRVGRHRTRCRQRLAVGHTAGQRRDNDRLLALRLRSQENSV